MITFAQQVLQSIIEKGVREFCLCPGSRNAPFIYPIVHHFPDSIYYWPEERSAAFFALGRIKATHLPMAVITTSGTAVAELLPATIEAYYTQLPLILITADRPRRFRGTGAPQSAQQVGIFSHYTTYSLDLEENEPCDISDWSGNGPLHLNICLEEFSEGSFSKYSPFPIIFPTSPSPLFSSFSFSPIKKYQEFLQQSKFPFVVVGALSAFYKEKVIRFLNHLQVPFYAEALSGIREESALSLLRITNVANVWQDASNHKYPIDGILRLGGIPTARFWRDIENKEDSLLVYSISEQPFSGLSWGEHTQTSLLGFFSWATTLSTPHYKEKSELWRLADQKKRIEILQLFQEEPLAEPSLIHALSNHIPIGAKLYLGNSSPIREWDLAATYTQTAFQIAVNRGMNGIDGQFSTFLGFCSKEQENWAILGDLTLLYDLVAPWVTSQLHAIQIRMVVINNGGGKIFANMFSHPAFQNIHQLTFAPLAQFWGWHYERWETAAFTHSTAPHQLIELVPDQMETSRFWKKFKKI
jgi:2-succinyl-5-enolpyruvyl-6-hydroxy-3-cyclohexene-1-carboxylate synthase